MEIPSFDDVRGFCFDLAFGTAVADAIVFDDLHAGLDYLYLPADELFTDAFKLCTTDIADPLTLPDETMLLSGHSDKTTVGIERQRYRL